MAGSAGAAGGSRGRTGRGVVVLLGRRQGLLVVRRLVLLVWCLVVLVGAGGVGAVRLDV